MKLDFNTVILDTEGNPVEFADTDEEMKASTVLRRHLLNGLSSDEHEVIKYFDWGFELKNSGVIDIDPSDKSKLTQFIIQARTMPILYKGQLLKIIKNEK